jgi:RimJ/RimL family protein N-acetyltransferase
MIYREHALIRKAEVDDASHFRDVFLAGEARAFVMDRRRELHLPTTDEIRELLGKKEASLGKLYAVENRVGDVRGFAVLRGASLETGYAELGIGFLDAGDCARPIADEALDFILSEAFLSQRLNKVVGNCAEDEESLRGLYVRFRFEPAGVQRQLTHAGGRYLDIETFSLFRRHWPGVRYGCQNESVLPTH